MNRLVQSNTSSINMHLFGLLFILAHLIKKFNTQILLIQLEPLKFFCASHNIKEKKYNQNLIFYNKTSKK